MHGRRLLRNRWIGKGSPGLPGERVGEESEAPQDQRRERGPVKGGASCGAFSPPRALTSLNAAGHISMCIRYTQS